MVTIHTSRPLLVVAACVLCRAQSAPSEGVFLLEDASVMYRIVWVYVAKVCFQKNKSAQEARDVLMIFGKINWVLELGKVFFSVPAAAAGPHIERFSKFSNCHKHTVWSGNTNCKGMPKQQSAVRMTLTVSGHH